MTTPVYKALAAAITARYAALIWSSICNNEDQTPNLQAVTDPTPEQQVLAKAMALASEEMADALEALGPPLWTPGRMNESFQALVHRVAWQVARSGPSELAQRALDLAAQQQAKQIAWGAPRK